jgi:hypothetical protein
MCVAMPALMVQRTQGGAGLPLPFENVLNDEMGDLWTEIVASCADLPHGFDRARHAHLFRQVSRRADRQHLLRHGFRIVEAQDDALRCWGSLDQLFYGLNSVCVANNCAFNSWRASGSFRAGLAPTPTGGRGSCACLRIREFSCLHLRLNP